jgi:hypothetical protein
MVRLLGTGVGFSYLEYNFVQFYGSFLRGCRIGIGEGFGLQVEGCKEDAYIRFFLDLIFFLSFSFPFLE